MQSSQQLNTTEIRCRASSRQRVIAAAVLLAVVGLFVFLRLAAAGMIDLDRLFGPCGFEQKYDLPCPTCGITTSAVVFASGRIFESFYIQPAGALFCLFLAIMAFFAFLTAVFGVYFHFLRRFFAQLKIRYIILLLLVILAGGWAVTLVRALLADK